MGGIGSGANQNGHTDGSAQDGLPQKPGGLNKACSDCWDDLLSQIPKGILRTVDGIQLETLTKLVVQGRALSQIAMANPSGIATNRAWLANADIVRKLSGLFGLSPTDRKRMDITAPKIETEGERAFRELMERRDARAEARNGK